MIECQDAAAAKVAMAALHNLYLEPAGYPKRAARAERVGGPKRSAGPQTSQATDAVVFSICKSLVAIDPRFLLPCQNATRSI